MSSTKLSKSGVHPLFWDILHWIYQGALLARKSGLLSCGEGEVFARNL